MATSRGVDRDPVENQSLGKYMYQQCFRRKSTRVIFTSTKQANDHTLVRYPKNPPILFAAIKNSPKYQLSPKAAAPPPPAISAAACAASPASPAAAAPPQKFISMFDIPETRRRCLGTVLNAKVSTWLRTRRGKVIKASGDVGRNELPDVAEAVAFRAWTREASVVLGTAAGPRTLDMMRCCRRCSSISRYRRSGETEPYGKWNGAAPTPRSIWADKGLGVSK